MGNKKSGLSMLFVLLILSCNTDEKHSHHFFQNILLRDDQTAASTNYFTTIDEVITIYSEPENPLIPAIEEGNFEKLKEMVKNGANIATNFKDGSTPLMIAAGKGNLKIVKYLVENGAPINALQYFDTSEMSACSYALRENHLDIVEYLLSEGARIDSTFLPITVEKNNYELTKFMLEHGADINIQIYSDWMTPLMIAVSHNDIKMVKLLLSYQADINIKSFALPNDTALDIAVKNSNTVLIQLLKSKGAK